jgi:hypothetical protein
MSNEAELCARALARFIHGARVRGVEIRRAGILTGEAEPTRASQQIQTNPSFERNPSDSGDPNQTRASQVQPSPCAAAFERTQLPAESTSEPSLAAIQTNPTVAIKRPQARWKPIEPKLGETGRVDGRAAQSDRT